MTVHDDSMFDEFVSDTVVELENPPVNDRLDRLEADVAELLSIVRPLQGIIEAMPEAMATLAPLIEGLKTSPVLKMLGIRI